MKIEILFFIYMIIINIASGIMFSYDKQAAGKNDPLNDAHGWAIDGV